MLSRRSPSTPEDVDNEVSLHDLQHTSKWNFGLMLIMLSAEHVVQVADESLGAQESPQSATDEVANDVIDAVEAHFVTTARWA